jgi:hypothetical protein
MSTIPYEDTQTRDTEPGPEADATPGRPRRRWWGRKTAVLAAVIILAAGFWGGVRLERSQFSPTTTPTATASSTAAGHAGFFGGAGGGGANASIGSVSSIDGNTVYLTDTSGNTVKVKLSSATKVTKSENVSKTAVRPGDTVVIQGAKSSNGTLTATSVSDSGASATRNGPSTPTPGTAG